MTTLDTMSAGQLRTAVERMLRPCATCGHAEIDRLHHASTRTNCAVDLGGEQCQPCACERFEVSP
jgi:hypothetical protein